MTKSLVTQAMNFEALASAELIETPCPWAVYEGVFNSHIASAEFPTDHFEYHSQHRLLETLGKKGSDAWYQHNVATRALLELGEKEPYSAENLDERWLQVAADLCSVEYRECISEVVKHDVRKLKLQAHFWRFEEGSFFTPHVDKAHKIVTHLMYLNDNWKPEDGGCLRILNSGDPNDVNAEVPPKFNTGTLLKRTDNAWHSVTGIPRGTKNFRKVLQVWFWESSDK